MILAVSSASHLIDWMQKCTNPLLRLLGRSNTRWIYSSLLLVFYYASILFPEDWSVAFTSSSGRATILQARDVKCINFLSPPTPPPHPTPLRLLCIFPPFPLYVISVQKLASMHKTWILCRFYPCPMNRFLALALITKCKSKFNSRRVLTVIDIGINFSGVSTYGKYQHMECKIILLKQ